MYDAQQGATSGAHIDMSTTSGTNVFHGQAYWHRGTNWLNAAPFFNKEDPNIPSYDKNPELHRETIGGTVGGPIIKDKLFGFISYQHIHDSDQDIGLSRLIVPVGLTNDRSVTALETLSDTYWGTSLVAAGPPPSVLPQSRSSNTNCPTANTSSPHGMAKSPTQLSRKTRSVPAPPSSPPNQAVGQSRLEPKRQRHDLREIFITSTTRPLPLTPTLASPDFLNISMPAARSRPSPTPRHSKPNLSVTEVLGHPSREGLQHHRPALFTPQSFAGQTGTAPINTFGSTFSPASASSIP